MTSNNLVVRELDSLTVGICTAHNDSYIVGSALVGWSEMDEHFYWEANARSEYGDPRDEFSDVGTARTRNGAVECATRALLLMREKVAARVDETPLHTT